MDKLRGPLVPSGWLLLILTLSFGAFITVWEASHDGTGGLVFAQQPPPPTPTFTRQIVRGVAEAKGIATGDFNNDDILDLIITNQMTGTATLVTGFGDGIDIPRQFSKEVATIDLGADPLTQPRSVAVADFDGDGALDFAVVNFAISDVRNSSVSILFQGEPPEEPPVVLLQAQSASGPQFSSPLTIEVGKGPSDLVVADFNGDQKLDLAVANTFSNTISIIRGQGSRQFSAPQTLDAGDGPQSIASDDFNGDGFIDLIVANLYSDDLTFFLGDGEGGFQPSEPIPAPAPRKRAFVFDVVAVDVAAGDLNGDGNLDVARVSSSRPQVEVRFGNGQGGFTDPVSHPASTGPRAVTIGDVNVDGITDIAVANFYGDEISLLLGTGGGGFAGRLNYSAGNGPEDLALGLFNLDPGLDLFVTAGNEVFVLGSGGSPPIIDSIGPTQGPVTGNIVLLINGQNFDAGTTVTIGGNPVTNLAFSLIPTNRIKLVVPPGVAGPADVVVTNADGSDTAVGAFTYTTDPIPELDLRFTRLVYCNAPTGDQVMGLNPCPLNSTKDSDVADFDGDGNPDIYAAKTRSLVSEPDEIFFNTGSTGATIGGTFVDDLGINRPVTLATGLFNVTSGVVTGDSGNQTQYDIQIADLNNDGDLDVVGLSVATPTIRINDGSNTFTEDPARITGLTPDGARLWDDLDIGDVDNDGDLDIIAAARGGPQHVILLNDGSANFTANTALLDAAATAAGVDPAHSAHDVEFVDIDNDGDLDIVTGGTQGASLPRLFLNDLVPGGTLNFSLVFDQSCPPAPSTCRLDPAPTGTRVFVAGGRPFGPTDPPDPANTRRVIPLDFNGDEFADLYFGGSGRDAIYLNRGGAEAGFFTRLENVPDPGDGFTYGGSFGDLDLDGRTDIIQGDYDGEPMIYLNRITPNTSIDDINASSALPFVAIPEPMRSVTTGAIAGRREALMGGSYWQAVTNDTAGGLEEPDITIDSANADTGLTPGSKTGFLGQFRQILEADVGDFDQDGDLDIVFSLGDHQQRDLRIYLNTLVDTAQPTIMCPADVVLECPAPTDPSNTGEATATDPLDPAPVVTFSDVEIPGASPQEKTIIRTWTATNSFGNSISCDQVIEVVDTTLPEVTFQVDVVPEFRGNFGVDDAAFRFVGAQVTDACDPNPTIGAVTLNGEVVQPGDVLRLKLRDRQRSKREDDKFALRMEAPEFVFSVAAGDASGNMATYRAAIQIEDFAGAELDEDEVVPGTETERGTPIDADAAEEFAKHVEDILEDGYVNPEGLPSGVGGAIAIAEPAEEPPPDGEPPP
ncbi:MAG: FG-GAP-like repeat-containing protein, partial [Candidatus Methylomirabilales bacterium]